MRDGKFGPADSPSGRTAVNHLVRPADDGVAPSIDTSWCVTAAAATICRTTPKCAPQAWHTTALTTRLILGCLRLGPHLVGVRLRVDDCLQLHGHRDEGRRRVLLDQPSHLLGVVHVDFDFTPRRPGAFQPAVHPEPTRRAQFSAPGFGSRPELLASVPGVLDSDPSRSHEFAFEQEVLDGRGVGSEDCLVGASTVHEVINVRSWILRRVHNLEVLGLVARNGSLLEGVLPLDGLALEGRAPWQARVDDILDFTIHLQGERSNWFDARAESKAGKSARPPDS